MVRFIILNWLVCRHAAYEILKINMLDENRIIIFKYSCIPKDLINLREVCELFKYFLQIYSFFISYILQTYPCKYWLNCLLAKQLSLTKSKFNIYLNCALKLNIRLCLVRSTTPKSTIFCDMIFWLLLKKLTGS